MRLEFMRVRPGIDDDLPVPARQTAGAAGLDLCAGVGAPLTLEPGAIVLVPTGWAVAIPEGFEGQVRPRSGLALKKGLTLVNAPGTIDADYRGEIKLPMINLGGLEVIINRGDRVAQMIISRVERPDIHVVADLSPTARGAGGFGSTLV